MRTQRDFYLTNTILVYYWCIPPMAIEVQILPRMVQWVGSLWVAALFTLSLSVILVDSRSSMLVFFLHYEQLWTKESLETLSFSQGGFEHILKYFSLQFRHSCIRTFEGQEIMNMDKKVIFGLVTSLQWVPQCSLQCLFLGRWTPMYLWMKLKWMGRKLQGGSIQSL